MDEMQKVLSAAALGLLVSLASIFLVSALSFSHGSATHAMKHGMTNCPFMSHEDSVCPMDGMDHITALRTIFEPILPMFIAIALIVVLVASFRSLTPTLGQFLRSRIHAFLRWRTLATYRYPTRPYQDLFAQGILHPKLYS